MLRLTCSNDGGIKWLSALPLVAMLAVFAGTRVAAADIVHYRYTGIWKEYGGEPLGLDGRRFSLELELDTSATPFSTQTIENRIEVASFQATNFTLTATGFPPATSTSRSSVLVNIYNSLDPALNGDYVYFIGFHFDTPVLDGLGVNLNLVQLPPSTFDGTQPQPFSGNAVQGFSPVFYYRSLMNPTQVLIEDGFAEAVLIPEPSSVSLMLAAAMLLAVSAASLRRTAVYIDVSRARSSSAVRR
jgi:hypothetical protein